MREPEWIPIAKALPPDGRIVDTKIDDDGGVRNVQPLVRVGRLWFVQDRSMYVYYTPTHWRSRLASVLERVDTEAGTTD